MPFKKFWNLAPDQKDDTVLNMYVYGQIKSSASFFGSQDDVVAGEFVQDLNRFPNTKTINVYINSPGGSVFAAAAIINQLRKHEATVHTWCDGICASAAVGILQAANPGCRHMSRATLLMVHNPSTEARGDQKTFLKTADLLAKVKKTLVCIYTEGTGLSEDQLTQMMDDETYLDADEAKALNFIDDITEETVTYDFHNAAGFVCNGVTMDVAAELNLDKLKSHLETLFEKPIEGGPKNMTFDEYLASLEAPVKALVTEAITAKVSAREAELEGLHSTALQEAQNANAALQAANTALQEQVNQLTAQLTPPDPQDAILNGLPEEAKNLLAQARADAVAAKQQLQQIQREQAFQAFKATFAEFDKLPLNDTQLHAIQNLSENNSEMYAELRELLKVANTALAAGFQATGSDLGTDVGGTAFDRMETAIKAYQQEHEGIDYNEAMKAVLREDPGLYDSYRNEMG